MSRRLRVVSGGMARAALTPSSATDTASDEAHPAALEARGYARGVEAGRAEAERELEELKRTAHALLSAIERENENHRRDLERQAVEASLRVGLEVGRRVLVREIAVDVDAVLRTVETSLNLLRGAKTLDVRVHPLDLDHITASGFLRDAAEGGSVVFAADASVDRGGCVIHSEVGLLDARIHAQLLAISAQLLDAALFDTDGVDAK